MSISLTTEAFTALVVLGTAASFTPGPNTTLSKALAANQGIWPAQQFDLCTHGQFAQDVAVRSASFADFQSLHVQRFDTHCCLDVQNKSLKLSPWDSFY